MEASRSLIKITDINLGNSELGAMFVKCLNHNSLKSKIVDLNINSCKIASFSYSMILLQLADFTKLTTLDISRTHLSSEAAKSLQTLLAKT